MGAVLNVELGFSEGLHVGGVFGLDAGEVRQEVELPFAAMVAGSTSIQDGGCLGAGLSRQDLLIDAVIESFESVVVDFDVSMALLQSLNVGPEKRFIARSALDIIIFRSRALDADAS